MLTSVRTRKTRNAIF